MKNIYHLINCERLHIHYIFDTKTYKLKQEKNISENCETQGWVKFFLGNRFFIVLYNARDIKKQTVLIGKYKFKFENIDIERKRFLCFYFYKIKTNTRKTFYYCDFNWFDHIYKKLDPTWDFIDEDHYDIFYKDFKKLKSIE